jgi:hypothetical protein
MAASPPTGGHGDEKRGGEEEMKAMFETFRTKYTVELKVHKGLTWLSPRARGGAVVAFWGYR